MEYRESMSEYIYSIYRERAFVKKENKKKILLGFLYDNFRGLKNKNEILKSLSEKKELPKLSGTIIAILIDLENYKNSMYFTRELLYFNYNNSLEINKVDSITYKEIKEIKIQNGLVVVLKDGRIYEIPEICEPLVIADILKYGKEAQEYRIKSIVGNIQNEKNFNNDTASKIIYSNVANASTNYGLDKFSTPRGHGFAAERANHLYDMITGKKAILVGDDNALNGADRVVDGVQIQSKYCASGSKCIAECFENGKFRYINPDGTPMQIEVPKDKYDDAVRAMKERIKKGEIPNVTDPEDAEKIVRKGHFTYEQAKNIAKFGTVESITFDSINGAIIAASSFGVSSCLTFAVSIWNGEDFDIALKKSIQSGLKVGGTAFLTAVLSSQLSRAGLNSILVGSSEVIIGALGPKASAVLVNSFRAGKNIYGAAAMKSAAKLLRGNIITGGISIVILSVGDITNIFRGRISGAQLFKNLTNTTATVAGGTAGWIGGATAGATIGSTVPIIGTAVGGIIGGIAGSFFGGKTAGKVSEKVLNCFIEDDFEEMVRILQKQFTNLAEEYLLNKKEAEKIINKLRIKLEKNTNILKDMYAQSNRDRFATVLLSSLIEEEIKNRKHIKLPTENEMIEGLKNILEELSDE